MTDLSWLPRTIPAKRYGPKTGRPVPEPTQRDIDRFDAKVEVSAGCWNWINATNKGYGLFWLNGNTFLAHRVSYSWIVGPIPKGITLDHVCFNQLCVNPDHLEPTSQRENTTRGMARKEKSSLYTGVNWHEANNKWQSGIRSNGVYHYLGYFTNEDDAARAYDKALIKLGLPPRNFREVAA